MIGLSRSEVIENSASVAPLDTPTITSRPAEATEPRAATMLASRGDAKHGDHRNKVDAL